MFFNHYAAARAIIFAFHSVNKFFFFLPPLSRYTRVMNVSLNYSCRKYEKNFLRCEVQLPPEKIKAARG